MGLLDDPRVGSEHLVCEFDLRRVDRPLALVTKNGSTPCGGQVALGVGEVAERPIYRPQAVGPTDDGDSRQRVVPLVPPMTLTLAAVLAVDEHRVVGVATAYRHCVALQRGGIVGDAEDHRLQPLGAGAGNLLAVDHSHGGLDQDRDSQPPLEPHGVLNLGEQGRHKMHVAGATRLRDHNCV